MNLSRLIVVSLALSTAACDTRFGREQLDVPASAVGAPDLATLAGVRLNMGPADLKRLRRVTFAPYTGFVDTSGAVEFRFQFQKAGDQENQSRLTGLEAVYANRHVTSDSAALPMFRSKVDAAIAAGRKPVACIASRNSNEGLIVEFDPLKGAYLQIGYRATGNSSGAILFERLSIDAMEANEGLSRRSCSTADFEHK